GVAMLDLNQPSDASENFRRALKYKPDFVEAWNQRGVALFRLKRAAQALDCYDRAVAGAPDFADAWNNRGIALLALKRAGEAIESYDRALRPNPNFTLALYNRANALSEDGRFEEAARDYARAIELQASFAQAHRNLGVALAAMWRLQEALDSFDRALALSPNLGEVHHNKASILHMLGRPVEAVASLETALALDPTRDFLLGDRLHARMMLSDWRDFANLRAQLLVRLERGERVVSPLALLSLTSDPALQRKAAQLYVDTKYPAAEGLGQISKRSPRKKIRLGYFSPDFRNHAVSFLAAELFERHDRERFETIAFAFGRGEEDDMRRRLERGFDRFIDVRSRSDADIARAARGLEIDIAIDLAGFTARSRAGIFAHRAAPIQVSYLGYLGTMAAPYMDYIIADKMLIPEADRKFYREKILYLPSYQVNGTKRAISPTPRARAIQPAARRIRVLLLQ
ncbi:MAG TPA: tetratricopeptide repeat protein, partial [Alphaproteobacteria bacterium]